MVLGSLNIYSSHGDNIHNNNMHDDVKPLKGNLCLCYSLHYSTFRFLLCMSAMYMMQEQIFLNITPADE